jgi:hypothetical protein
MRHDGTAIKRIPVNYNKIVYNKIVGDIVVVP